jgi:toxin ParE1/3/4
MRLRYERGALADLEEIFAYIAVDNPRAAARLVARIETVAKRIAEAPYMGEATRRSGFRRFPVGNYLIVYEGAGRGRGSKRRLRRCPARAASSRVPALTLALRWRARSQSSFHS